ncbi:MAG: radical SAM protein [Endomicrobiales bacterium]|nr:radical SAM protein [Endomicrobiales bacterium]
MKKTKMEREWARHHNRGVDPEILEEYVRVTGDLEAEPRSHEPSVNAEEGDFSQANSALNAQERFKSLYCKSKPLYIQIELTNRCNLKCLACGVVKRKEETLPRSMFSKLSKVYPYLSGLIWLGGEVFVVDYFFSLLEDINRKFPHIGHTIYTNGLLIDRKIASVLTSINYLELKFSIDSVVKETYEQIRNLGKYEVLLQNLSILNEEYQKKSKKSNMGVNVIVMKNNLDQLLLYPDFCRKYGIDHLDMSFLADSSLPCDTDQNIFKTGDKNILEKAKGILSEVGARCREHGIRFYCNFNSCLEKEKGKIQKDVDLRRYYNQTIVSEKTEKGMEHLFQCYYPWASLFIKCNGIVVPTGDCIIPIGDMLEDSFEEIWNGEAMMAYRKKLSSYDLSNWCAKHCRQKAEVNKKILSLAR